MLQIIFRQQSFNSWDIENFVIIFGFCVSGKVWNLILCRAGLSLDVSERRKKIDKTSQESNWKGKEKVSQSRQSDVHAKRPKWEEQGNLKFFRSRLVLDFFFIFFCSVSRFNSPTLCTCTSPLHSINYIFHFARLQRVSLSFRKSSSLFWWCWWCTCSLFLFLNPLLLLWNKKKWKKSANRFERILFIPQKRKFPPFTIIAFQFQSRVLSSLQEARESHETFNISLWEGNFREIPKSLNWTFSRFDLLPSVLFFSSPLRCYSISALLYVSSELSSSFVMTRSIKVV